MNLTKKTTLTKNDMYDIDDKLSVVENMLVNTQLDDEAYLINSIRSYIRIKRAKL